MAQGNPPKAPYSITPDGRALLYRSGLPGASDLGVLLRGEDGTEATTRELLTDKWDEVNGELSPDGRYLAYQSNESGRHEIYVRPFPEVDSGRWQVTTGGGFQPLWSRAGDEIFFRDEEGGVFAVGIDTSAELRVGNAALLFPGRSIYMTGQFGRTYDVSLDGRRFLMIKHLGRAEGQSGTRLVLVQNWLDEIERLLPNE